MKTDLVRQGYAQITPRYVAYRAALKSGKYVQQLLKYLPKGSSVLDLGCGAGTPVDDVLIKSGHVVTGLDISPQHIALARNHCPGGSYSVVDMETLQRGTYSVQAVVCLYALFHIPRTHHQRMLSVMASYLPKGGMLLITMGDRAFEGEHQLLGTTLWSSQYGTMENSALIRRAGFKILLDEIDTSGGERHQVILAEKL